MPAYLARLLPALVLLGFLWLAAWLFTEGPKRLSHTTKVFLAIVLVVVVAVVAGKMIQ